MWKVSVEQPDIKVDPLKHQHCNPVPTEDFQAIRKHISFINKATKKFDNQFHFILHPNHVRNWRWVHFQCQSPIIIFFVMNVSTNFIVNQNFVLLNSCKQTTCTLFTLQGFREYAHLIMRFPQTITLENAPLT